MIGRDKSILKGYASVEGEIRSMKLQLGRGCTVSYRIFVPKLDVTSYISL